MSEWVFMCASLCKKGEARRDADRAPAELRVEASTMEEARRLARFYGWVGIEPDGSGIVLCCSAECLTAREEEWERSRPARHAAWLTDYAEHHSHARGTSQAFLCGATAGTPALNGAPTCPLCRKLAL